MCSKKCVPNPDSTKRLTIAFAMSKPSAKENKQKAYSAEWLKDEDQSPVACTLLVDAQNKLLLSEDEIGKLNYPVPVPVKVTYF